MAIYPEQETVTPESLLLDTAERIGRVRQGYTAMHLHLSRLRPQNQRESHRRIALRMFDHLVNTYRSQLFPLSNGDIVVIGKDIRFEDYDQLIYKLRALFSKDPLVFTDTSDDSEKFATVYAMESEFGKFIGTIRELFNDSEERKHQPKPQLPRPMTPQILEEVQQRVRQTDMGPLVRRQAVVSVQDVARAKVAFEEYYISMGALAQTVAPAIDILSDRWLFLHLSETIDRAALPVMGQLAMCHTSAAISLNLNISTVLSQDFAVFSEMLGEERQLVVELQTVDIFHKLDRYFEARRLLRDRGHKILLDGLTPMTLKFVDMDLFDADYVKVVWDADLFLSERDEEVRTIVQAAGPERFVISRCDSENAVRWGRDEGILCFQGRFIDSIAGLSDFVTCENPEACQLPRCVTVPRGRGRAIS